MTNVTVNNTTVDNTNNNEVEMDTINALKEAVNNYNNAVKERGEVKERVYNAQKEYEDLTITVENLEEQAKREIGYLNKLTEEVKADTVKLNQEEADFKAKTKALKEKEDTLDNLLKVSYDLLKGKVYSEEEDDIPLPAPDYPDAEVEVKPEVSKEETVKDNYQLGEGFKKTYNNKKDIIPSLNKAEAKKISEIQEEHPEAYRASLEQIIASDPITPEVKSEFSIYYGIPYFMGNGQKLDQETVQQLVNTINDKEISNEGRTSRYEELICIHKHMFSDADLKRLAQLKDNPIEGIEF